MTRQPWWGAVAALLLGLWAGAAHAQVAHDLVMVRAGAVLSDEPLALPDSEGRLTASALLVAPEWMGEARRPPAVAVELQVGTWRRALPGQEPAFADPVPLARVEVPYLDLVVDPRDPRARPTSASRRRWCSLSQGSSRSA